MPLRQSQRPLNQSTPHHPDRAAGPTAAAAAAAELRLAATTRLLPLPLAQRALLLLLLLLLCQCSALGTQLLSHNGLQALNQPSSPLTLGGVHPPVCAHIHKT